MSNYKVDIIFDKASMQYLFVDGDKAYAVSREFVAQHPEAAGVFLAKMMKSGRGETEDES